MKPEEQNAVTLLLLARKARVEKGRRRFARLGLARAEDDETRLLLLAELYRSYFAERRYREALETARRMAGLRVLEDGAHARAAVAAQALGDDAAAERHLRAAVKTAPGERRAHHHWVLGTFFHGVGRARMALQAFEKAAELDDGAPLYGACAALARCTLGERPEELGQTIARLEASPSREGHGRFVLGLLYRASGDDVAARRHLGAFLRRCEADPTGKGVALRREMEIAREALGDGSDPGGQSTRAADRRPRPLARSGRATHRGSGTTRRSSRHRT